MRLVPVAVGIGLLLCLVGAPREAQAAFITVDPVGDEPGVFDFAGVFTSDNDVALIEFLLPSDALITIRTTSHAAGGFDPYLALFDTSGNLLVGVGENDDEDFGAGILDSFVQITLAGAIAPYTLAISQTFNFPHLTLADGYDFDDDRLFTQSIYGDAGCGPFVDPGGEGCRLGSFAGRLAIEPLNPTTPVPEPATFAVVLLGVLAFSRRRFIR